MKTRTFELPLLVEKKASITWNAGKADEITKTVTFKFNLAELTEPEHILGYLCRPAVILNANKMRAKDPAKTKDGGVYHIDLHIPGVRMVTTAGYIKSVTREVEGELLAKLGRAPTPAEVMVLVAARIAAKAEAMTAETTGEEVLEAGEHEEAPEARLEDEGETK